MENLEYLLPDDYVEEATTEPESEVEEIEAESVEDTTDAEEVEEQPTEVVENGFKLPYKYNHEEGELTDLEEAQKLVQMGMLYRSKESEFNDLRANKGQYEKIASLAELYGMDADGLYDTLYNQYLDVQAEERGLTPEMVRKERELADKERILTAREQSEKAEAEKTAMYTRFREAYPEVDPKEIKPETWALVEKGTDLSSAYTMQLNRELREQLKILTQNVKNKSSSPSVGTTRNGTADATKNDDFLDGLFG